MGTKAPVAPKSKVFVMGLTIVGGKAKNIKVPKNKVTYQDIANKLGLTNWLFVKPDGTVLDMKATAVERKLIATPNVKNG